MDVSELIAANMKLTAERDAAVKESQRAHGWLTGIVNHINSQLERCPAVDGMNTLHGKYLRGDDYSSRGRGPHG